MLKVVKFWKDIQKTFLKKKRWFFFNKTKKLCREKTSLVNILELSQSSKIDKI